MDTSRPRAWLEVGVLIFVVSRTRLDRYEELRRHFEDWRDVRIVLDRREGERRTPYGAFTGTERRRVERRQPLPGLRTIGWAVVESE